MLALDLTALAGAPSLVVVLARDLVAASPLTQDHWGDWVRCATNPFVR
ncbi:hypothetical protein PF010_g28859 [Phytophthora fragariae]|uniref:Uncharacterized protein n=1 Tax=Phytophthora fragariae TaxID=53985 RepID=A0A6A3Q5R8_9STRA|nr:hypothetical protein PF003_g8467 [Phytophthora fragariae]KAE8963827.1 hypothetical protein PF011_g28893 [Phytophthora fragariae]KAE9063787.1 hypothetical protein PF010_g28859 [Phytophthora fragariae]KAE9069735.1 hypothetical protein PF006_g29507 [Phytophthora fragariae]KAE9102156.1 hypothetical protein PF007_g14862 [Phytophthora fragariae]